MHPTPSAIKPLNVLKNGILSQIAVHNFDGQGHVDLVFLTDVGVFTAVVLDNIVVYDIGADYFFDMHRSDAGYSIFVVGSVAENGTDVDFV